jgi:hypothetical protein
MTTRETTDKPLSAKAEKLQRQQDAVGTIKTLVQCGATDSATVYAVITSNTDAGIRARVFIATGKNEIKDITGHLALATGRKSRDTGRWEIFYSGHGFSLCDEIADDVSRIVGFTVKGETL